jgi:hypothetical protein
MIFRSSIARRKSKLDRGWPITARRRGSVRNALHLLSTGEMASSRNRLSHRSYVLWKKSRTAGFVTAARADAR